MTWNGRANLGSAGASHSRRRWEAWERVALAVAWLGMAAIALAQDSEPLRVEARVPKGTYYVGQGIEVRVGVVARGQRPALTLPRLTGAAITPIDTAFRQVAASGIGDQVDESNLFVSRFRVVPTVAGPLTIPPFFARVGERSGASSPIRLTIHPVPADGRPASYLRGVGRIEAKAEAEPQSVRLGTPFEYRIILNGPGARGSTLWPTLDVPEGLTVEPATTELVADPPSRTFHFRVKPSVPSLYTLPSVPVATFDPASERYAETRAPAVTVRVVDVPRFDPTALQIGVAPARSSESDWDSLLFLGLFLPACVGLIVCYLMERRERKAQRWARDVARRAAGWAVVHPSDANPGGPAGQGPPYPGDALVEGINSGLTGYLRLAFGRAEGALTPHEARTGVLLAVDDAGLADRAARLVAGCDRVRFGREADALQPLAAEASAVFAELGRRRVRKPD